MTRNPLADPGILGVNEAAFAVVSATSGVSTRAVTPSAALIGSE